MDGFIVAGNSREDLLKTKHLFQQSVGNNNVLFNFVFGVFFTSAFVI